MTATAINLGLDYIFPKLHGMWSECFYGDRLDVLVRGGLDGFGRAVADRDVQVTNRTEVQKRLTIHFIKELAGVRRFLSCELHAYYSAFIRRYFYEDLKVVMRGWHRKESAAELRDLLLFSDQFPELPVEKMLAAKNVNQFYRLIPGDALREAMLPILVELDDDSDLWLADSRVDRLMMREFYTTASGLSGEMKRVASELVGTEVDSENIILLLRKSGAKDFPADRFESFVLDNGRRMTSARVLELAPRASWGEMVAGFPTEYATILRRCADSEPYRLENVLWCDLYRRMVRLFRDFNRPALSAIVFPYMKRFELMNLARLFEGLHLRLDPQFIHSILVR